SDVCSSDLSARPLAPLLTAIRSPIAPIVSPVPLPVAPVFASIAPPFACIVATILTPLAPIAAPVLAVPAARATGFPIATVPVVPAQPGAASVVDVIAGARIVVAIIPAVVRVRRPHADRYAAVAVAAAVVSAPTRHSERNQRDRSRPQDHALHRIPALGPVAEGRYAAVLVVHLNPAAVSGSEFSAGRCRPPSLQ